MENTKYGKNNILETKIPEYLKIRLPTGIIFFDRMLGGGFVPSITHMLSGDPGSGKTTFMIQVADALTGLGHNVLFNSTEQTEDQVVDLIGRLKVKHGFIFAQHKSHREVMIHAQNLKIAEPEKQVFIIVDSITKMASGSRAQAQKISEDFITYCQTTKAIGIFLVHTTKGGQFAGNNTMKHDLDAHFHLKVNNPTNDDGMRTFIVEKHRYARRIVEDMMLTDHGHISADDIKDTTQAMPVYVEDKDFKLI